MSSKQKIIILAVVLLVIQVLIGLYRFGEFAWKYWICSEVDLSARYGHGSWAVITGASSGQGRIFAIELARRGFNLVLIGSARSERTRTDILALMPDREIIVIVKNFALASSPNFFDDIETTLMSRDCSILINNVAHRSGWIPYHEYPVERMAATIATGTYVQARLIHMLIGRMNQRSKRSAIINITAQCQHSTWGLGMLYDTTISVPYLSVYEATNAFGYYHACSIMKEYSDGNVDMLNITPGAVLTENTECLKTTPFAVTADIFVANCLRLLGNWNGTTCAYWGHELSGFLINLAPWIKAPMLKEVGINIARTCMTTPVKTY